MGSFRRERTEIDNLAAIHDEAEKITFGVLEADEIKKLSAVEINNPQSFNQLGKKH